MEYLEHDSPSEIGPGLVKVVFEIEEKSPGDREILWASPLGVDYILLNVPLLIFGVSYRDIVSARRDQDGILTFVRVERRGGHSTYRLMLTKSSEGRFAAFWSPLERMGCRFEAVTPRFLAVDIPPRADIYAAYGLMEAGMTHGVWTFEEGHCGHPLER
jgi:hypothetical protein